MFPFSFSSHLSFDYGLNEWPLVLFQFHLFLLLFLPGQQPKSGSSPFWLLYIYSFLVVITSSKLLLAARALCLYSQLQEGQGSSWQEAEEEGLQKEVAALVAGNQEVRRVQRGALLQYLASALSSQALERAETSFVYGGMLLALLMPYSQTGATPATLLSRLWLRLASYALLAALVLLSIARGVVSAAGTFSRYRRRLLILFLMLLAVAVLKDKNDAWVAGFFCLQWAPVGFYRKSLTGKMDGMRRMKR